MGGRGGEDWAIQRQLMGNFLALGSSMFLKTLCFIQVLLDFLAPRVPLGVLDTW